MRYVSYNEGFTILVTIGRAFFLRFIIQPLLVWWMFGWL